jgi:hypothetical protein
MAMMAMTTSSSIKVKPQEELFLEEICFIGRILYYIIYHRTANRQPQVP